MFRDFINRLIGKTDTQVVKFNIGPTVSSPEKAVHRENTTQAVKSLSALSNSMLNAKADSKHTLTTENIHLCNGKYLHSGLVFKKVPQDIVFGMVHYNGALTISKIGEGQSSSNNTTVSADQTNSESTTTKKKLYFHYGTGEKGNWANPKDIQMDVDQNGHYYACFPVNVPIGSNKIVVHAAIHDGTGVWDNNFGSDYTLEAELKKFKMNS